MPALIRVSVSARGSLRLFGVFFCHILLLFLWISSAAADATIPKSLLPFDPLPVEEMRAFPRKIFARWHVHPISVDNADPANDFYTQNFLSPDGYGGQYSAFGGFARERPLPRPPITADDWQIVDKKTEVARAIALGLDGFAFSVYQLAPKPGWQKLLDMLDAAQQVDPGFKVMLTLDFASLAGSKPKPAELADAIASVAPHPSLFRTDDGRLVVTGMAANSFGADYSSKLVEALADRGISTYFVAIEHGWQQLHSQATVADGYGRYGAITPDDVSLYQSDVAKAHARGKSFIGVVTPQVFRPRAGYYAEARNSELFRATWKLAIDTKPDWVLLKNWNDYAEGNDISPSTGVQWSFYDLSAYYNTWYKTGHPPEIKRDVLYYFHRIQPTTATPLKQTALIKPTTVEPPEVTDNIELLAFLTKAGRLVIILGKTRYQLYVPAGISSFKVPLGNGVPKFQLWRSKELLAEVRSAFKVRDRIDYQDLLYRGGSSTRPVVDMVANPPTIQ